MVGYGWKLSIGFAALLGGVHHNSIGSLSLSSLAVASLSHNRRLRVLASIKMVDHPWLWHGVLTRMVVLEDRPRIVASLDTIMTVDCGGVIQG